MCKVFFSACCCGAWPYPPPGLTYPPCCSHSGSISLPGPQLLSRIFDEEFLSFMDAVRHIHSLFWHLLLLLGHPQQGGSFEQNGWVTAVDEATGETQWEPPRQGSSLGGGAWSKSGGAPLQDVGVLRGIVLYYGACLRCLIFVFDRQSAEIITFLRLEGSVEYRSFSDMIDTLL